MKRIILILFVFTITINAQTKQTKSLLDLKNQINQIPQTETSQFQVDIKSQKKNPGLAIIYSLLLPGMGELYAGGYDSGMYFTIADGVIWSTLAGLNIYGNWQADNYKAFAESRGGVDLNGKDATFYANAGEYLNVEQYNRAKELNRDFDNVYDTQTHYWNWASNEQRREYRSMWSSSEQAFNNVRFAVGALLLNRLVSAINAVRIVTAYNKNLDTQLSWNIFAGIQNNPVLPPTLTINFSKTF